MRWDLPAPFVIDIRVDDAHIDALGHANNAVYLSFCEQVAWAHSEARGLGIAEYHTLDRAMAVQTTRLRYLQPSFAGDELQVEAAGHAAGQLGLQLEGRSQRCQLQLRQLALHAQRERIRGQPGQPHTHIAEPGDAGQLQLQTEVGAAVGAQSALEVQVAQMPGTGVQLPAEDDDGLDGQGQAGSVLVDGGVRGYDFDQCFEDYRASTLLCLLYSVLEIGSLDTANERGLELFPAIMERALSVRSRELFLMTTFALLFVSLGRGRGSPLRRSKIERAGATSGTMMVSPVFFTTSRHDVGHSLGKGSSQ